MSSPEQWSKNVRALTLGIELDVLLAVRKQVLQVLHEVSIAMRDAARAEHERALLVDVPASFKMRMCVNGSRITSAGTRIPPTHLPTSLWSALDGLPLSLPFLLAAFVLGLSASDLCSVLARFALRSEEASVSAFLLNIGQAKICTEPRFGQSIACQFQHKIKKILILQMISCHIPQ